MSLSYSELEKKKNSLKSTCLSNHLDPLADIEIQISETKENEKHVSKCWRVYTVSRHLSKHIEFIKECVHPDA